MFRLTAVLLGFVACAVLVAPVHAVDEPTATELFTDTTVHDLRLNLHAADWAQLQATYLENTFYPADFTWNGYVVRNVGIRSRGTGSRDAHKPSLRVTFDEYVSGQTFAGLKGLVLDNFRQDPAMMKESLSMALFARMGLAAPRVSHARVYVNGEYLGLFGVIEPIDKRFLRRTLGEDTGYLYEFEWSGDYRFEWLGGDPARYAGMFEAETRESEPLDRQYATLVQMIETTTRGATSTWVQAMSRYVDFTRLFAYLAVESFLSDRDGLAGEWGSNNFYLYRYADRDRFEFLPWDKDVTFQEIDRDVFEGTDTHHLFATALQFPELRQQYLEALQRVAAIAGAPQASGQGWLEQEVRRHAATIRAAAHADPSKAFTNERFEQEIEWMAQFSRFRVTRVEDFAR